MHSVHMVCVLIEIVCLAILGQFPWDSLKDLVLCLHVGTCMMLRTYIIIKGTHVIDPLWKQRDDQ